MSKKIPKNDSGSKKLIGGGSDRGSSSTRYTREPPVPVSQSFEEEIGVGAHDSDYSEAQKNYDHVGIEGVNECNGGSLRERKYVLHPCPWTLYPFDPGDQCDVDSFQTIFGNDVWALCGHGYVDAKHVLLQIEEGLGISEQLPEDEGGDNEVVGVEVFDITCNGIESDSDQVLNIGANELETGAGQIPEFESHENERNCEHVRNFESGDPRANSHQLLELHSYGLEDPRCGARFAIRLKSSWTKRSSKEKCGAVLCCNSEGFKTMKEANSRIKEARTGCLAMIRLRLVESNRWKVDEVKLEHNHLFYPERVQNSESQKKMDAGVRRKLEPAVKVEVCTVKLYRTPAVLLLRHQAMETQMKEQSAVRLMAPHV
ncbi:hypothetical protein T459_17557 [Capsicum annuum]|uniref:FAR1 domain-containing protein n=1 Tax=Capsicum annuum TaxID=4072 RepID=A0A2G2ZCA1_CAPAN|nr:hypothetical protein T459_17557 [Capsicum annuum]